MLCRIGSSNIIGGWKLKDILRGEEVSDVGDE